MLLFSVRGKFDEVAVRVSQIDAFHFAKGSVACNEAFLNGAAFFSDFLFSVFDAVFDGKA